MAACAERPLDLPLATDVPIWRLPMESPRRWQATAPTGFQDGEGCTARLSNPSMLALSGNRLFVYDQLNYRIRIIQLP